MVSKMNFFIVLAVTLFCVEAIIAKSSRSMIKLTHPMSIHSPFYKPNSINTDSIFDASEARFKFLNAKARNLKATNAYRIPLYPSISSMSFLAEVSIGTPEIPIYLVLDTGSSFTWTQCIPCKPRCKKHRGVDFDYLLSQSVWGVRCGSPECNSVPGMVCVGEHCRYSTEYEDGSETSGIAMIETFTFHDGSTAEDIVFGCGFANDFADVDSSGILGLGPEEVSILHRLGSKFSYCLGYLDEPEHHFLMIGNGALILGNPSPLIVDDEFYYVSLEGIMVGGVHLNIDPELFRLQPDGTGGVIIDSGAVLTYLLPPAYEALKAEVARIVNGLETAINEKAPHMLCYKGFVQDLKNFPFITLNFEGGQTLQLNQNAAFFQRNSEMFCLAFNMSYEGLMNVIGYTAQQNYNVGYDVLGHTIHFHRARCQDLAN